MNYAVAAPAVQTLTVAGRDERYPVNRIFCVGRNYAAHAREMGKDPDRDPPFYFMKPAQAIVDAAQAARSLPTQDEQLPSRDRTVLRSVAGG
jgi:fumarylpyruvate hydrolase